MTRLFSDLQEKVLNLKPNIPPCLKDLTKASFKVIKKSTDAAGNKEKIKELFPHIYGQPLIGMENIAAVDAKSLKVGVVFSGGQASGGHNVIIGLFDGLKKLNPNSTLWGFLNGPQGILDKDVLELNKDALSSYLNQGGFDLIGSGRTKIESDDQLEMARVNVESLQLDGLVVIGGDDSNTNAAVLAEFFKRKGLTCAVVGIPKTIDGDLKNTHISISFGHDTACRIYSEMVGNIGRDCLSAKKYYHFIRLMGRSASHITLECALQTQANWAFISEEVEQKRKTLKSIIKELATLVSLRAEKGKNYGVILIPEGLIEFIPEFQNLISELNRFVDGGTSESDALENLTDEAKACFNGLSQTIKKQLLMDRDPHGNVQVSHIETEQLLMDMLKEELEKRKKEGHYNGSFHPVKHFFGYEGRSSIPSRFDANYCYALGMNASALLTYGHTGYVSQIKNLHKNVDEWSCGGIPLTMLFNMEERKGKDKPVIQKALVELDGAPFKELKKYRDHWALNDNYITPGPIQYFGADEVTDQRLMTMQLEQS
jgi:diphosphate-dependent phosphofructokinase